MTPTALEPLRFPISGSRLIEASAGTGKTFTIAALYLRLVLGHGDDGAAFSRPLTPPEILVVTFTDAATKELRDRIRARLAEAAAYFRAEPSGPAADGLLQQLRDAYLPEHWPACARKLQLAAEWMDEAAVSTIHSWCNRMLREHAFDSDSLFTQRLETDQADLLAEVVRDYWRSFMYPLGADAARQVRGWWGSPEALQGDLKGLLNHVDLLAASADPAAAVDAAQQAQQRTLAALKAPWAQWVDDLQVLLDTARDKGEFNGTKLKKNNYDAWLQTLAAWRDDPEQVSPDLTPAAWARLTPAGLDEVWKPAFTPPQHPALAAIAAMPATLAALPDARLDILRHAAQWVAARFADEQARRAQMGFNDLLTRLDEALAGPNGARLAEVIRAQFPVALIDEFQDTDAIQYRIFDAIYRVDANDAGYCAGAHRRPPSRPSTPSAAPTSTPTSPPAPPPPAGCTPWAATSARPTPWCGPPTAASSSPKSRTMAPAPSCSAARRGNPVPFFPADANGRKDALQAGGEPLAALNIWRLPPPVSGEPMSKTAYLEAMADVCASEMVRLLNLGQRGEAGFAGDGGLRALRQADLAVLVNNRSEADAIRGALASRGVRSVYLSEKDSVFQRPEAFELQLWLSACAEPDDGRALRAALATQTLGLDWASLDRLNHDEIAWDDYVLQFRAYRDCWRRQGVLPMLRRLLNEFRVPARLLAAGGSGERSLTDLLHLAELLQQASSLLDGEHALIRHLAEQRREDASGGEARQVRLESDADLVQVVTIHKSKGLEYPLVFLPFACAFRATKATDLPLKWHDAQGRLQLSLTADAALLALADRERLGEDLRKLYVALTRARYATWIGAAPLDKLENSAFGHLIGPHAPGRHRRPGRGLPRHRRHRRARQQPGRLCVPRAAADRRPRPLPAPRRPRALVDRQLLGAAHRSGGGGRRDAGRRRLPRSRCRRAAHPTCHPAGGRGCGNFGRAAAWFSPRRSGRNLFARDPRMGRRPGLQPRRRRPGPAARRRRPALRGARLGALDRPAVRLAAGFPAAAAGRRRRAGFRPRRARHLGGRDGVLGRGA